MPNSPQSVAVCDNDGLNKINISSENDDNMWPYSEKGRDAQFTLVYSRIQPLLFNTILYSTPISFNLQCFEPKSWIP
jgi:hypothetical protein